MQRFSCGNQHSRLLRQGRSAWQRHHDQSAGVTNPFPEPVGVFRSVKKPTYEEMLADRIKAATEKRGPGTNVAPAVSACMNVFSAFV